MQFKAVQRLCSTQFIAVKISTINVQKCRCSAQFRAVEILNNECPKMQVLYTVDNSIELTNGNREPVHKVIIEESVILVHNNVFRCAKN